MVDLAYLVVCREFGNLDATMEGQESAKIFKLVPRSVTTKKDSADLADLALIIRAAIHKFMVRLYFSWIYKDISKHSLGHRRNQSTFRAGKNGTGYG